MAAPVALFVYKRLWHTTQTVASLLKNEGCAVRDLYIFSDAARHDKDRKQVQEVRKYIRTIQGFRQVYIFEQSTNLGLANSIIGGVTQVLEEHDSIIVMEDDLVVSPHFLRYMDDGLKVYADNEKVASIHGYIYPVSITLPETFFLRGTDCWGWATWKRAWQVFNPNGAYLLDELRSRQLDNAFDYNEAAQNIKMLEDQIAGRNDSWAIRWHASAFLKDMYTLFPGVSLVRNIGMDGQGTHGDATNEFETTVAAKPVHVAPVQVEESASVVAAVRDFYLSIKPTFWKKVKRKLFKR